MLQLSGNWDILFFMYSSGGSKNMKPPGICIEKVGWEGDQRFQKRRNKWYCSFTKSMAAESLAVMYLVILGKSH